MKMSQTRVNAAYKAIHDAAPVSPVEPTTCPKCRSNTRAYRLAVADVIDGRMVGMTSCRDEWHSRLPMVSPVEPEPPTNPPCVRCGHALSAHRPEFGACDGRERPCACPEYQAPTVEPEPPTTCRCLDCEPLTDPGPKPSEDDINRLEQAAWDSKTDRVLVWYRDRAEMFRQRLRETERAWQLDRKKPTVELEPCVWRESGNRLTKAPCFDSPWFGRHAVAAWKVCPYCGAPLKVER